MAELKTQITDVNPIDFLETIENISKKNDCLELLKIFSDVTGYKPVMWGNGIIGFGSYHYKSDRSVQEGDWPITGFSPRKQNITIYIMPGFSNYGKILNNIGKYKISKGSCLYIRKLSDINIKYLKQIVIKSVDDMKKSYIINNI